MFKPWIFQSTLPVGGATVPCTRLLASQWDFNPRSPWGERQFPVRRIRTPRKFQSTLPVGGATKSGKPPRRRSRFQSTLPVGGATKQIDNKAPPNFDFNPRSPWGERRNRAWIITDAEVISIHAPRGGSDCADKTIILIPIDFNPRSPWGERLSSSTAGITASQFQSTLPVGGATQCTDSGIAISSISIHAPRGGSDRLYLG